MQVSRRETIAEMRQLASELFPIARSIAGPGLRESLRILSRVVDLAILEYPSGQQVFDWVIPKEWELHDARVTTTRGELIIDATRSNLEVLNYSKPVKQSLTGLDLRKHLFYSETRPHAIPYRTSYYSENWGFCCTKATYDSILDEEIYDVAINTSITDGSLSIGEALLPGESEDEIVFTCYLCHPSMAVNELSGPLTVFALYRMLAQKVRRKYTYRFIITSETIGSIAYLANNLSERQETMIGGIAFQMTGLNDPIIHRDAREPSPLDAALHAVATQPTSVASTHYVRKEWSPVGGGDQRQWCSQGINLPMSYLARNIGGTYPEYHTSDDDLSLLDFESAYEVARLVAEACEALEGVIIPSYEGPGCEPRLSKYGLQNPIGGEKASLELDMIKVALGVANGKVDSLSIASEYGFSPADFHEVLERLEATGLISLRPT